MVRELAEYPDCYLTVRRVRNRVLSALRHHLLTDSHRVRAREVFLVSTNTFQPRDTLTTQLPPACPLRNRRERHRRAGHAQLQINPVLRRCNNSQHIMRVQEADRHVEGTILPYQTSRACWNQAYSCRRYFDRPARPDEARSHWRRARVHPVCVESTLPLFLISTTAVCERCSCYL